MTKDLECNFKQIGIAQTFEGCFLEDVAEIVIIFAVIVCIVNVHMFITIVSVGVAW